MAVTEEATWAPPLAAPAIPPSSDDRAAFAKKVGIDIADIGFEEFTKSGYWNVDNILKPMYEEAGQAMGRQFNYSDPTKKY